MTIEIKLAEYKIKMSALKDGKVRIFLFDQHDKLLTYTDEYGEDLALAVKLVTGVK